jgi:DNA modification methylase
MIKLLNEDCYTTLRRLKDKSIDLIITDPPYKFENKGGGFYKDNESTKR